MYCSKCGKENLNSAAACVFCGFDICEMSASQKGETVQNTQTCGLAVWSLCLEIFGLVFLTAIPAIICGHIVLGRIKRSRGLLSGKRMAIEGLVLGYFYTLLLILSVTILLPALLRGCEEGLLSGCARNLAQIGWACQIYAKNNKYMFPDKLFRLYPKYIDDAQNFVCPSKKSDFFPDLSSASAIEQNTSYRYFPGFKFTVRPDTILAEEKSENHIRTGRNILRVDGSVTWEKSR